MRQSRKYYAANKKKMANFRAAKERKRQELAMLEEPMPDTSHVRIPRRTVSGFRVTVECLDDGDRVSFTCRNGPHGLTISPTLAGQKVSVILNEYKPITK